MNCEKRILILVGVLCLLNAVGLSLVASLSYTSDLRHIYTHQCFINSCLSYSSECCTYYGKGRSCRTCYKAFINFELILNTSEIGGDGTLNAYNQSEIVSYNDPFCPSGNVTCYFDGRNIQQTLSLQRSEPASIIGVIILSVLQSFLIVAVVVSGIFAS